MRARLSVCGCLLAAVVMAGIGSPAVIGAQNSVKRVLIIHGGPENFPGNSSFDAAIRQSLFLHPTVPVEAHTEDLENEEFGEAAYASLRELIRIKFREHPIDLVIANTAPALQFLLRYRDDIRPGVPIVFAAATVPPEVVQGKVLGVTGIAREPSHVETVELALKLHPGTKRLHVVAHVPAVAGFRERVRTTLARFAKQVNITYGEEPTVAEMLATLKTLPEGSLVFYVRYSAVAMERKMFSDELLTTITDAASVPVYCSIDTCMGTGVVGGVMRNGQFEGGRLGQIALDILEGAAPESIPIESTQLKTIFDWRELRRWHIDESRLPPGSDIRFRVHTTWELYGPYIVGTLIVVGAQLVLIAGLLYERRARHRAELESRQHLALAADANRRLTMTALSNSITHELGQPLSAVMQNAQALQMMLTSNRATPDTIAEIASDIRTQGMQAAQIVERHRAMLRSHVPDRKPINVHTAVRESLALVAHDLRSRQIHATLELQPDPCMISGDQVQLQQVFVNLVMNAIDAMAETPPASRRIAVRSESRVGKVCISVSDRGTGLSAHVLRMLFTPFVTTKSQGLGIGLIIARTIVDAHGGSIDAHNNAEGGATFTVILPCSGPSNTSAPGPNNDA